MNQEKEIWKNIPNYEGYYQASSFGRIKSLTRLKKHPSDSHSIVNERILKPGMGSNGRLQVGLHMNGKRKTRKVHQLIAIVFLGHVPCGFKIVVDHDDNNPLNNHVWNLRLITQRKNRSKDQKGGTSKYTGVCWCKSKNKWIVGMYINGKRKNLGAFTDELEASRAYQNKLKEL